LRPRPFAELKDQTLIRSHQFFQQVLLAQSLKLFPWQPLEPIDISAGTNPSEDPGPTLEVVAELMDIADKAQKGT